MRRYGIPDDVVTALRTVSRQLPRPGAPDAEVTRPLADGEPLELRDRALEVQHRPGHSPSDTVFWDSDREILLAADHLIAHISSNPLICAAARRLRRAAAGAGRLHRVDAPHARAPGRASSSPATATRSPTTAR